MKLRETQKPILLKPKCWYRMALGNLNLFIMKQENEFQVSANYQKSNLSPLCKSLSELGNKLELGMVKERLYLGNDKAGLYITLQLADKPYQVNPSALIKIAPKGKIVLYASTPLWVQLKAENSKKIQAEYPTVWPRLSWVGSSTTEGMLCYSTKIEAPSLFEDINVYSHRAITALEVINDGETVLEIDRLSLPVKILSLFYSSKMGFWTESVRYRVDPDSGEMSIVAGKKPPEDIGEYAKIANARDRNRSSRFKTAMNLLIG